MIEQEPTPINITCDPDTVQTVVVFAANEMDLPDFPPVADRATVPLALKVFGPGLANVIVCGVVPVVINAGPIVKDAADDHVRQSGPKDFQRRRHVCPVGDWRKIWQIHYVCLEHDDGLHGIWVTGTVDWRRFVLDHRVASGRYVLCRSR